MIVQQFKAVLYVQTIHRHTINTWQASVYLEFFFDGSPDEIRDQEEALATQLASR